MSVDVTVPDLGESITEVEVAALLKQKGDTVAMDEPLIELESDKATVEVPAPVAGRLVEILVGEGDVLKVGDVMARIAEGESGAGDDAGDEDDAGNEAKGDAKDESKEESKDDTKDDTKEESKGSTKDKSEDDTTATRDGNNGKDADQKSDGPVMPAAQRAMTERGIDRKDVQGSGPGGRVLKQDVPAAGSDKSAPDKSAPDKSATPAPPQVTDGTRETRRERMSPIRRKIAERLVDSQQTAALLTTFNEIDMTRVKALRAAHQEAFVAKYEVKLGFMSFFMKAAVEALRLVPQLNAQIDGEDMIHHDYCDIGIAVGGGKGLVVPVIRNAEVLDFGGIEQTIADYAQRAQANKLDLSELQGGTFTISNGGVYGSLMSTPIVNPPQSGVLGLHAIQDRPVVIDGEITVRPMMYIALTYDHRLVDGREAVTFLRHIKECVEQPERLLLKV